jgi:hypothetical protein
VILFGIQNRILVPFSAAIHRALIPLMGIGHAMGWTSSVKRVAYKRAAI